VARKKFTAQELQQFDLDTLIGVNCQLQVVHNLDSEGRVWANVAACIKAPRNLPPIVVPQDYIRVRDREVEPHVTPPALVPATKVEDDDDIPF